MIHNPNVTLMRTTRDESRTIGEWIGFEKINHHATDGVAIGGCFLYDVEGPIGSANVAALRQLR